jgi:hypothetical protein
MCSQIFVRMLSEIDHALFDGESLQVFSSEVGVFQNGQGTEIRPDANERKREERRALHSRHFLPARADTAQ